MSPQAYRQSPIQARRSIVVFSMDHVITFQVMLPPLEPNDVIVQIKACGLSRIDTKVCRVKPRLGVSMIPFSHSQTLSQVVPNVDQIPVGNEISGIITKGGHTILTVNVCVFYASLLSIVGDAVTMYSVGDEVTGL